MRKLLGAGVALLVGGLFAGEVPVSRLVEGVNAAPSPDGKTIAFQKRQGLYVKLGLYDIASGTTRWVEDGAVCAAFPAWSPKDSTLIYALGDRTHTAYQNWKSPGLNEGYRLRTWKNGVKTDVLEHGRWYDCSPSFAPDGRTVWYCSNRQIAGDANADYFGNRLWRMTLGDPASGTFAYDPSMSSNAGVSQPVVSPDGRFLCWAELGSFSSSWCLKVAHVGSVSKNVQVTHRLMAAYSPNWSPDGTHLTFTGCSATDTCWSVYLLEPRRSLLRRVCDGENSSFLKEGAGCSLVFDREGYVCKRPLTEADYPTEADETPIYTAGFAPWKEPETVLYSAFSQDAAGLKVDQSVSGDSRFKFNASSTSFWRVKFDWDGNVATEIQDLMLMSYRESGNGSQVYLALHGKPHYSTRQSDTTQAYVYAPTVLLKGVHVITGIRTDSYVWISVDNGPICAESHYPLGLLSLDTPTRLRIGVNAPEGTRVLSAEIGSGWPSNVPWPKMGEEFDWEAEK